MYQVFIFKNCKNFSDNIVFAVSDGQNFVEFLFPIYIAFVDTNYPVSKNMFIS